MCFTYGKFQNLQVGRELRANLQPAWESALQQGFGPWPLHSLCLSQRHSGAAGHLEAPGHSAPAGVTVHLLLSVIWGHGASPTGN